MTDTHPSHRSPRAQKQQEAREGALTGLIQQAGEKEFLDAADVTRYLAEHAKELGISAKVVAGGNLNLEDLKANRYDAKTIADNLEEAQALLAGDAGSLAPKLPTTMEEARALSAEDVATLGADAVQAAVVQITGGAQ